jgi:peptide/nickel transport system substrate-binding protein
MKSRSLRAFVVSLAFLLLLLPLALLAQEKKSPKYGGTLRMGSHRDITSLNPFFSTQSETRRLWTLVYEPLITTDEKFDYEPHLASSWKISPDGMVYTFEIRRGVKFHNGTEMTAEDIRWSIEYVLDPINAAYGRPRLLLVSKVEAVGPHTLRVQLKSPSATLLGSLADIGVLMVVPKGSVQSGKTRPDRAPPGTGPFQLVSWQAGRRNVFKKFDQYWKKGLPYLDEIIFDRIPEETVRFTALRSGELDLIGRVPYAGVLSIRSRSIQGIQLGESVYSDFRRLVFNVKEGPFKDKRLRQAVAYALDKKQLIQGAYFGLGIPTNQKLVPGSPFFFTDLPDRTNNLEQAKRLLKEAGYEKGLKFSVIGRPGYEEQLQVIQSQLKRVGLEMVLQIMDAATYDERQRKGQFVITPRGGQVSIEPDDIYYPDYHSETGEIRIANFSGFSHPEVDRLLEEGRVTIHQQRRREIYRKVMEIINEETPEINLAFIPRFFGFRSHVKDFRIEPVEANFYHPGGQGWGLPMVWLDK